MRRVIAPICALVFATMAFAGADGPARTPMGRRGMGGFGMGHPMEHNLFPPELVLRNQVALGLSTEQVDAIKKQVGDTHARVLDAQVDLHRVTEQLDTALEPRKVDEGAVLGPGVPGDGSRKEDQDRPSDAHDPGEERPDRGSAGQGAKPGAAAR